MPRSFADRAASGRQWMRGLSDALIDALKKLAYPAAGARQSVND
jgi:hypothetical protein